MMNHIAARQIVIYVNSNSGCMEQEIVEAFPNISGIKDLLDEMSEGGPCDDGFILSRKNGRYYLGPKACLFL